MRKIGFYVTALVASVLASCSNEENIVSPVEEAEQFVAVIAEGESRTFLGGNSVLWTYDAQQEKTDKISIFRKNGYNTEYYLSSVDENNVAIFTYSKKYDDDSKDVTGLQKNFAVYPYQNDITITSNGIVTVAIPSSQTFYENTFDPAAAFMFAVSDNQKLGFKNANALMKFELIKMPGDSDYTINSIVLTSASKALNGPATIAMNNDEPTVTLGEKSESNNSLTLTCTDATVNSLDVDNPNVFYLVVTPGTYNANDLKLTFNVTYGGENKSIEKTISEDVVLNRNSIWKVPYILGSEDFTGEIAGFGSTSQDAAAQ